ncbi:sulfite exporter TauE/SafE family protein [Marinimicrococcus flavescens]|uniref:Probable membrane transporter protein n=1 Tax=Marinimicrococcus flavescens TaxID=3031815 RepID=A0AAP4D6J5_9PROT|nr:sulfite exporter TauE/SafE family protein [Marinimicrococcus flavescens]
MGFEAIGIETALTLLSGGLVGFTLGLIGGGGSILAVPLLIHVVGVQPAHMAIGTSALAVGLNACANLLPHARAGHVRWRSAGIFALAGVLGALGGAALGKLVDGQRLLLLFALLMLVVAGLMLRRRAVGTAAPELLDGPTVGRLGSFGLATGGLSGFFGIGGGFLVVPGLIAATSMPTLHAVGSSLVAVASFGMTTAASYAASGLVDGALALRFILAGVVGGWAGMRLATRLGGARDRLGRLFAAILVLVALYMLVTGWQALAG